MNTSLPIPFAESWYPYGPVDPSLQSYKQNERDNNTSLTNPPTHLSQPVAHALFSASAMEIGSQNRQHGSMSFDKIYHPNFPQLRLGRNTTTISLPDQRAFIPTSSPLPACYTNAGYGNVIGLQLDVPYTPFGQDLTYTNVSQMSSFTPSSYGPVSYASIHSSQSQKTRRTLHSWVPASQSKHP